jgi:uncharacterized protein (DUF362 family)
MGQRVTNQESESPIKPEISRRDLFARLFIAGTVGTAGVITYKSFRRREDQAKTFIAKAASYDVDLVSIIKNGMRELGFYTQVSGKRVLLKPNLLEASEKAPYIHTHPHLIRAVAKAMLKLDAKSVVVGEGSAHYREIERLASETGLDELLAEDKIRLVDLNSDELVIRENTGGLTGLKSLTFPATTDQVDLVVSMPKMKTHHWAGVTLSMKNMFGLMPGIVYGWPKNIFHCVDITKSILDINATLPAHFAIVDGIVGMEGDGPLAGEPKPANVIIMGQNLTAVDATAARIMRINPWKIPHLKSASGWLGTVGKDNIIQVGEQIAQLQTSFSLLDGHKRLRLKTT